MTNKNATIVATALISCLLALTGNVSAQTPEGTPPEAFRNPFTVKFQFSKHNVEQKFDKIPYVSEKTISVFPGEEFGVNIKREGEEILEVSYQPDLKKADVKFKFEVQQLGKRSAMMLTTHNELDETLVMEGWMLLPGYKESVKTSLVPVWPHLMGVETWPQPILKLELKILRLTAPPKGLTRTPQ